METTENMTKSNLLVAILCSILFGLVGTLIFGLLYYLGIIAWIGAYAIVMLAGFGYKKFYGKIDKKGYFIVSIISLIEALIAIFFCLGLSVSKTYDVSFGTAMGAVFEVLGESQVLSAVISDILFSVVFIIAGIVTYYFIEKKNNQKSLNEIGIAQENKEQVQVSNEEQTNGGNSEIEPENLNENENQKSTISEEQSDNDEQK